MASVDIIESSGKAYFLVWRERAYLWKLALVPILIKLVCDITVISLGWDTEFLKQTLIMLPGYLAEGWMLAHFVRLIFLDHRWPFRPTGNIDKDLHNLRERARGIMGGMVIYTLIKMAMMAFVAFSFEATGLDIEESPPKEPSGTLFLFSIAVFAFFAWAFRCLWLYIPVALNYPVRDYLKKLGSFSTAFSLIGTWLICFLPIFFLFGILISYFLEIVEPSAPAFAGFVFSIARVFMDTLLSLIVTGGICYVIADIIGGKSQQHRKKL